MDKKKKDGDGDREMTRARNAYDKARSKRNKEEEARWANVIGNILVRRGESIPALAWFLHDHSVSKNYLSNKHLIPSCQSLAQIYIARNHFEHALDLQVLFISYKYYLIMIRYVIHCSVLNTINLRRCFANCYVCFIANFY